MKTIVVIIAAVLLLGLVAAGGVWWMNRDSGGSNFQTTPVKRGELLAVISATGAVEPEESVDIGAQVQGQILEFGKDADGNVVNFNSRVTAGEILALIDPSVYEANVKSAQADLDTSNAAVVKAEADLKQMNAKLGQAQADWERAKNVGQFEALAQSSYDAYRFGYEAAAANVDFAAASLESARKSVPKAEASLQKEKRNLEYCTIKSPVNGTVISRRVNIGQTVVSSFNSPSLFLIAKDLSRIQVWASVNEVDVGEIKPGQPVTFTVDTFPDRIFKGAVSKVRMDAQMTQNVVTYPVEISADNSDLKLRPYMTANVSFQVARHDDVLLVPNTALRWTPQQEQITPGAREAMASDGRGKRQKGSAPDAAAAPTTAPATANAEGTGVGKGHGGGGGGGAADHHRGTIWIQDGEFVKPIKVRLGLTDRLNTEVTPVGGDELKEGAAIIIGETRQSDSSGGEKNPFAPQLSHKRSH